MGTVDVSDLAASTLISVMSDATASDAARVAAARAFTDMHQAEPVDLTTRADDLTDEQLHARMRYLDASIKQMRAEIAAGKACPECGRSLAPEAGTQAPSPFLTSNRG